MDLYKLFSLSLFNPRLLESEGELAAESEPESAPRSTQPPTHEHALLYFPVRLKFSLALAASLLWAAWSLVLAQPWIADLASHVGTVTSHAVVLGIAIVPGFMNAFLVSSLLLDRRPRLHPIEGTMPGISILVAAYNEQDNIVATLRSIERQNYDGPLQVIVIDDGSTDATAERLAGMQRPWFEVIRLERNMGKSRALNAGLARVRHGLTITVDGDSCLYRNALRNLVGRYLSDPPGTRAVAGEVLVRNSRKNLVTKTQEWDYFHGIAAIKRLQSLYQGTLVAQGAFSLYETDVLREVGGWPHSVGEDIVLTWDLLERGYRVGFAENACLFTNVPERLDQFIHQRQRWSRGLIEAFKAHWRLLFKPRLSTIFIWWNLLFPYLDFVYTLVFIPGLVLALFGVYWIAGPMTLFVLPLALLVNLIMFGVQSRMFKEQRLKVRNNPAGFLFYALCYSLVLQPACVIGYLQEVFNRAKRWGTK
jgi:biofilm PGA synthesis N-glycosyltransferase PgaC